MKVDVGLLQTKWEEVLSLFQSDRVMVETIFADLVTRYREDGRYYHNLHHIHNVLQTVETLQNLATDYTAVQLAAWFHDVIYHMQPAANHPSNETQSANYAAKTLKSLNIPVPMIALVHCLICATQLDVPVPDDPNFHVLLDADLATLALAEDQYDQYAQAIRREYAFVPDDAYRNGRCQVLQSFLDRARIFLTEPMYLQCEQAARENIQREIDQLQSGDA